MPEFSRGYLAGHDLKKQMIFMKNCSRYCDILLD